MRTKCTSAAIVACAMLAPSIGITADAPKWKNGGPVGSPGQMTKVTVGCLDSKDTDTLTNVMREGDKAAFMKYATEKIATAECALIPEGTKVMVEDASIWHGTFCVRPQGEARCLWLPQSRVSPYDDTVHH